MSAATVEQTEAAALAEANAGFASVRDDGKPAEVPKVEVAPAVETLATPEPAKVEVEPPPMFAGYSKEQIDAVFAKVGEVDTLAKQLRAANGKIGELNGKLQEFQKPAPLAADVPAVDDSEFAQTYPEFEARIDAKIAKITTAGTKAGLSPEEVDAKVANANAELRREFELERLTEMHGDFNDLLGQPGYQAWLVTQPADVQESARTTGSAKVLGKIITDYKTASVVPDRNKSRLEAAITPSGVPQRGTPAPSPLDEAMAGYAAVRGKRQ